MELICLSFKVKIIIGGKQQDWVDDDEKGTQNDEPPPRDLSIRNSSLGDIGLQEVMYLLKSNRVPYSEYCTNRYRHNTHTFKRES